MGVFRMSASKLAFLAVIGCANSWAGAASGMDSLSLKAVLDLKPIAFWTFNDSTGDTLRDASGNGRHGLIKGAKRVEGIEGGALALDGRSWIEIPGDSGLETESFTFSIWLRQSGNGSQAPLMEFQKPNAQAGVHLWANTYGFGSDVPGAFYGNLRPYDPQHPEVSSRSNEHLIYTEGGSSQGGRWNHVVLTYDHAQGAARIYVNGKLQASQAWEAFFPSTVGSLLLGMRSATSLDNEGGRGLVGTLDDGAIFDRTLSETEVLSLYGRAAVDPSGLHFGIKTYYAKASDTLWIPVYLTSEGRDSLSLIQLNLELDTTVVELLDVRPDTSLAHGWQLSGWSGLSGSRTALALAGTRRLSGPGEGELLRLKVRVLPAAKTGASTMLTLSDISVDEGRVKAVSNQPGKIFVLPHALLLGDVNGDSLVDTKDAELVMQYVIGRFTLPNAEYPHFTLSTADVSGNGEITSYDAALILQYGLGIIEDFPVERKGLAKRSAQPVPLTLEGPIPVTGNRYHYRILASNMDGLIGGRLSLDVGRNISGIGGIATGITGARATAHYDPQSGILQLGMVANRKVRTGSLILAEWDADYAAGSGLQAINLNGASLNEGALSVSGLATALQDPKLAVTEKAGSIQWALEGDRIRVLAKGAHIESITVMDTRGRIVLARTPAERVSMMEIGLESVGKGLKVMRVKTDKGGIHSILCGPAGL
jgi:hypothetical protein